MAVGFIAHQGGPSKESDVRKHGAVEILEVEKKLQDLLRNFEQASHLYIREIEARRNSSKDITPKIIVVAR